MTNEQAAWLRAHPEHRPLGTIGDFQMYTQRGTLKPDGTFVAVTKANPLDQRNGSFGVGILSDRRDVAPEVAPVQSRPGFQRSAAAAKPEPAPIPSSPAMPPPGPLPKKV